MTTPVHPGADQHGAERDFIERLSKLERGKLAELRRALADERPGDSAQFLEGVILRAGLEKGNRRAMYLVASLYALIERPKDDESEEETAARTAREGRSVASLLGEVHVEQNRRSGRKSEESSSTEKRFLALLDADEEALPYQLRQAVSLLKGGDVKPDWARLLRDASGWKAKWGDQVRRRWARDFYRVAAPAPDNEVTETGPPEASQEDTL